MASQNDLKEHTKNTIVHITEEERALWNGKTDSSITESLPLERLTEKGITMYKRIDEEGGYYTQTLSFGRENASDGMVHSTIMVGSPLNGNASYSTRFLELQHQGTVLGLGMDGTISTGVNYYIRLRDKDYNLESIVDHPANANIHITTAERATWNSKVNSSALDSKADTLTLNTHMADDMVHVTANDRRRWDASIIPPVTFRVLETSQDRIVEGNEGASSMHFRVRLSEGNWRGECNVYPWFGMLADGCKAHALVYNTTGEDLAINSGSIALVPLGHILPNKKQCLISAYGIDGIVCCRVDIFNE